MNYVSNPRSLPVQIRILALYVSSISARNLSGFFQRNFPSISSRLFILGIAENNNLRHHLELRKNIESHVSDMLKNVYYDVIVKTGSQDSVLASTAIQHGCDLIVLPHLALTLTKSHHLFKTVSRFIKSPIVPVFLLPDQYNAPLPFETSLLLLNPDETSRLGTAFIMRTARLVSQSTILLASGKDDEKSATYLDIVRERYWPLNKADSCKCLLKQAKPVQSLSDSFHQFNPDFFGVSLQCFSSFTQRKLIDSVVSISVKANKPALLVNRSDWIRSQEKQMTRIYNTLSEFDLALDSEKPDLDKSLPDLSRKSQKLFLGCYSYHGLNTVFQQYGLFKILKNKGYVKPLISFEALEGNRERLRVFPSRTDTSEPLVDIIIKIETNPVFKCSSLRFPSFPGNYLHVEWLCLQDPCRSYRDLEIPLPGQKYPGLGIGWKVMIIIKLLAKRLGSAAIFNMPENYYAARLYHRFFRYADPYLEGRLQAIDRDTFPLHLVDASWAFLHGLVLQNSKPAEWLPGPQIMPLHSQMIDFFNSSGYRDQIRQSLKTEMFALHTPGIRARLNNRTLYTEPGSIYRGH